MFSRIAGYVRVTSYNVCRVAFPALVSPFASLKHLVKPKPFLYKSCLNDFFFKSSNLPILRNTLGRKRPRWKFHPRIFYAWTFSIPFFTFESEKEKEPDIVTMMKYAVLAFQRGEAAKAERLLHVALKAAQEVNDVQAITYIYDLMANFALKNEEFQKAETLFVDVLKRFFQDGMAEDDNAVVDVSLKLSSIYASLGDLKKALQGFEFCIGTQEAKMKAQGEENVDENTLVLWAMSHDWFAKFLLDLNHYALAKDHFLRAYDVCLKVKGPDDPQTAVLLNDLGSVSSLLQNYEEAIQYLKEAISVAERGESEDLATFNVNLGIIYLQKELFEEAEKYCMKGRKIAEAGDNEEAKRESVGCLDTLKKLRS